MEKCLECTDKIQCLRFRTETNQKLENYSFLHYFSYLTYFPLFATGPILPFNAYSSQISHPQKTHTKKDLAKYALRVFVGNMGVFFIFLTIYYGHTIATNPLNKPVWQQFSLLQVWTLGLLELFFLWFKFLVFWRVARLFALLDGIETTENMNRCVVNNYCFESFWRSWHRSFNQWLIRYIFIPLGGTKYKSYNIWVVFTFVAIWHDLELNLLVWAWGICLSLVPEITLKWYFTRKEVTLSKDSFLFRSRGAEIKPYFYFF
jgi:protein-cysteine N-palmitoyltransferase HHAT